MNINNGGSIVVVPHKGVKRTQLHPSDAQFLGSVKQEAAYIGAHERNAKYLEIHHHCCAVNGGWCGWWRGGCGGAGKLWGACKGRWWCHGGAMAVWLSCGVVWWEWRGWMGCNWS